MHGGCLAATPPPNPFDVPVLGNQAAGLSKFLQNNSSLCSFAITAEGNELSYDLPTSQRAHMNQTARPVTSSHEYILNPF